MTITRQLAPGSSVAPGSVQRPMSRRRVLMALMFFPRGGSAQVARYMARALPEAGWDVTLVAGRWARRATRRTRGRFFEGVEDVRTVDYTRGARGRRPAAADPPFQPSFEDRDDAPDRVFAVGRRRDLRAARLDVGGSARRRRRRRRRRAPPAPPHADERGRRARVPRRAGRRPPARHRDADAERDRRRARRTAGTTRAEWADRHARVGAALRAAAGALAGRRSSACRSCSASTPDRRRVGAERLRARRVRQAADRRGRRELWRRWLVEEPRGWDPESQEPGSVCYSEERPRARSTAPCSSTRAATPR